MYKKCLEYFEKNKITYFKLDNTKEYIVLSPFELVLDNRFDIGDKFLINNKYVFYFKGDVLYIANVDINVIIKNVQLYRKYKIDKLI